MRSPLKSAEPGLSVVLEDELVVGVLLKGKMSLVNNSDILLLDSSEPSAHCADEHCVPASQQLPGTLFLFHYVRRPTEVLY